MLPSNIEHDIGKILQKNNGWLRKEQCAKQYARDPLNGEVDGTKRTNFYRWTKKIEKGKVKGFQLLKLPGNISYIGFENADPKVMENLIQGDTKIRNSVEKSFGFFEWLNRRAEMKRQEREYENAEFDRQNRKSEYEWACRHAEMNLRDDDPEYLIKCDKIRLEKRKEYGLDA